MSHTAPLCASLEQRPLELVLHCPPASEGWRESLSPLPFWWDFLWSVLFPLRSRPPGLGSCASRRTQAAQAFSVSVLLDCSLSFCPVRAIVPQRRWRFWRFDVINHLLFHKLTLLCWSTPGPVSGLCSEPVDCALVCTLSEWPHLHSCVLMTPSEGRRAEPSDPSRCCRASGSAGACPWLCPLPHVAPHSPLPCWACPQQGCCLTCSALMLCSCGPDSHQPSVYLRL